MFAFPRHSPARPADNGEKPEVGVQKPVITGKSEKLTPSLFKSAAMKLNTMS